MKLGTQQRKDAAKRVEAAHALERAEGKKALPPLRAALAEVRALPAYLIEQLCALARRPVPPQTVVALLDVLALLLTPEDADGPQAQGAAVDAGAAPVATSAAGAASHTSKAAAAPAATVALVPASPPDTDELAISGEEISRDPEVAGLFSSSMRIGMLVVELEQAPVEVQQRGAPPPSSRRHRHRPRLRRQWPSLPPLTSAALTRLSPNATTLLLRLCLRDSLSLSLSLSA